MSDNDDFNFLMRRVAELEGDPLSLSEASNPKPDARGGADRWQTGMETRLLEIKADLRNLRSSVGALDGATAVLRERVAHLPSRGFIAIVSIASLAAIGALVAFQAQIQLFLKTIY